MLIEKSFSLTKNEIHVHGGENSSAIHFCICLFMRNLLSDIVETVSKRWLKWRKRQEIERNVCHILRVWEKHGSSIGPKGEFLFIIYSHDSFEMRTKWQKKKEVEEDEKSAVSKLMWRELKMARAWWKINKYFLSISRVSLEYF